MSGPAPSADRGHLATEQSNPRSSSLESMSPLDAVDLFRREDAAVIVALEGAREDLAKMIEIASDKLKSGGRLVYVGAGTSGRLGVLDASECPPTFGVSAEMVQAIIAGGERAVIHSVEDAEDHAHLGAEAVDERGIGEHDFVIGIAAGGTTPFVHGALARAAERHAATGFITCVPRSEVSDSYDVSARLVVGPEVLAGSSRLKAGTVTKLALNTITTVTMSRLGKTHRGRMVDVNTNTNSKLVDRGMRLVVEFGQVDRTRALELLRAADGHAKTAIVMARLGVDAAEAKTQLESADGLLARALGEVD